MMALSQGWWLTLLLAAACLTKPTLGYDGTNIVEGNATISDGDVALGPDAAPGPPKQWTVLVDTLLPDNGSPCGTFFQASEPRQSSAPVTAYRYALRTLLSKAASETLGTGDLVDRLAIQCANPRRGTDATNRRIRLEVTTTPLTEEQVVDAVDHFLHAYYMSGAFSDAVVALGGGGDFTPTIFMYKLPTSAVYAVCIEGTPGFWCPEEAHRGWDPDNAITA